MKKSLVYALLFVICLFSISSALSAEKTFDEVVELVDAISFEGNKTFSNKEIKTFNGPNPKNFFTLKGAVLFWYADTNCGDFWLFNKDEKHICIWNNVEKKHYSRVMDELMNFLPEYVDFNDGGKITFIITSEAEFTNPFIQLEYSTVPNNKSKNYYTDSDEFCEAIKTIVNSTILK